MALNDEMESGDDADTSSEANGKQIEDWLESISEIWIQRPLDREAIYNKASDYINKAYEDIFNGKVVHFRQQIIVLSILLITIIELIGKIGISDSKSLTDFIMQTRTAISNNFDVVISIFIILLIIILLIRNRTTLRRIIIVAALFTAITYLILAIKNDTGYYIRYLLSETPHFNSSYPQILLALIILFMSLLLAWSKILQRKVLVALAILLIFIAPICTALIFGIYDITTLREILSNLAVIIIYLLQYFAIILLLFLIWILVAWISEDEGLVILPFNNAGTDLKYDGKAISDLLVAELIRIYRIHEPTKEKIWSRKINQSGTTILASDPTNYSKGAIPEEMLFVRNQNLAENLAGISTESLANSVANVGTIGVGGTPLSIGLILVTLKRLCPLGNPGSMITGSIQRYGSVICLSAHIEHLGRKPSKGKAWKISREIVDECEIPALIKDLAFLIVHDLSLERNRTRDISARTWMGFKHFTEAIDSYNQYVMTGDIDNLNIARTNCIYAAKAETNNVALIELFRILGAAYNKRGEYKMAEEMFQKAIVLADQYNGD